MMSAMKNSRRKSSLSFVLICVSAAIMMAVFFGTMMMIRASMRRQQYNSHDRSECNVAGNSDTASEQPVSWIPGDG